MHAFSTLTLAVAALAAAAVVVAGEKCDYAVVGPKLHTLGTQIADCMTETGYNAARPAAPPTAEQATAICDKCTDLVSAASALTWPDCTMMLAGSEQTLTAYFDSIIGQCKAGGAETPATTTKAPETMAPAPSPTTQTPQATTETTPTSTAAGSAAGSASSGSGAVEAGDATTPEAEISAPSSSPTSTPAASNGVKGALSAVSLVVTLSTAACVA